MTGARRKLWAEPGALEQRERGERSAAELRRAARDAGFRPGIAALAIEGQRVQIVAEMHRCKRVKAWCRWVLHCNTLAAICVTIFALHAYEFILPFGLECAALGVVFGIAHHALERADQLHVELIRECNEVADALHEEDIKILAWVNGRR